MFENNTPARPFRTALRWAVPAVAIALLAGCASPPAGTDSKPGGAALTPVKVALDWSSYVGYHSILVVADDEGYFADHGLDVEFTLSAGSKDAVVAVGTGQADVGWVDLSTATASMLADVPVKAVATVQNQSATGLTVLDGTPIDGIEDVKGLRIGSTPGGSDSTLLPAFLEANGLSVDDVTVVSLPANGKLAALITGDVDAISGQVYYYSAQLESQGQSSDGMLFSEGGLDVLDHGIVAGDAFIASNPTAVSAFVEAFREGLATTIEDPTAACEATVARSEGAMTQEGCEAEMSEWLKLVTSPEDANWGTNDLDMFESTVAVLTTFGGVEGSKETATLFTNDFLSGS